MKTPHIPLLATVAAILACALGLYLADSTPPLPQTLPSGSRPESALGKISPPARVEATSTSHQTAAPASPLVTSELHRELTRLRSLPASPMRDSALADLYARLAVADGSLAIRELFAEASEPFRRQMFGYVLTAWADTDPAAALAWFHDPQRDHLAADGYAPTPDFYQKGFRQMARTDLRSAAGSLPAVERAEDRLQSVSAIVDVARSQEQLDQALDALGTLGELRPLEQAWINHLVGDTIGYGEWRAKVTDTTEGKILDKALELSAQ